MMALTCLAWNGMGTVPAVRWLICCSGRNAWGEIDCACGGYRLPDVIDHPCSLACSLIGPVAGAVVHDQKDFARVIPFDQLLKKLVEGESIENGREPKVPLCVIQRHCPEYVGGLALPEGIHARLHVNP
jgi:hypothetical protein